MNTLKIAARNILRNVRRSVMTTSAVAIGAISMLLFGAFVAQIFVSIETQNVVSSGHLAIYKRGYFQYGAGDPAAYGIADYRTVMQMLLDDPELTRLVNVTPTINLFGIAGNFDSEASKTFFGLGVIPVDYNRMHLWDEHRVLGEAVPRSDPLNEADDAHGIIGAGLGRILKLCEPLKLNDCAPVPSLQPGVVPSASERRDFHDLREAANPSVPTTGAAAPRLDLLAATSAGAPNVVNFFVDKAEAQGAKEIDDALVIMNFSLAQRLLYGRGTPKAIGIVIQLHRTEDMGAARARIETLIKSRGLDLEIRDLKELQPFYKQVIGMFSAIFSFISMVMAMIVLFTVVNTMSMSVMERTPEIGTLRAIGVKKRGINRQFVSEGMILGLVGATVGILLGLLAAFAINHAGLTWQPPASAEAIPLRVRTRDLGALIGGIWSVLVVMSVIAAWIPARRAARMTIVTALGHT
jgi:putative ABC transport system permease protein